MASVSQGPSVSTHPASQKPADPTSTPATSVHHPSTVQHTKSHHSHPDQHTDASLSAPPTSTAWHQAASTLPQQHVTIPTHPAQQLPSQTPTSAKLGNVPKSSSQRSQGSRNNSKQHAIHTSTFQTSQPLAPPQTHAPVSQMPPQVAIQAPIHEPTQPIQQPHQRNPQQLHSAPQQQPNPAQRMTVRSRARSGFVQRPPQHVQTYQNMQRQQHLVRPPVQQKSTHQPQKDNAQSRIDSSQVASQQLATQQLVSQHQNLDQQPNQSQGQRKQSKAQQSADMRLVQQQSLQISQQQPRRTYRTTQSQDPKNQFGHPASNSTRSRASYPQQGASQFQQITQKQGAPNPHTQDIQQVVPQGQQGRQTQRKQQAGSFPAAQPLLANSSSTLTAAPVSAKPIASSGNAPNGQVYQVQMAIPQGAIAVSGAPNVQYAGSAYPNAALFDQLNMNPSAVPLSNVTLAQAVPGQNVTIIRTIDRQGQEAQIQHVQGRAGVQGNDRGGVITQDIQGLVEHGQQQVIHHAPAQGPGQHELQGHGAAQHAIGSNMYAPVEQQQAAQQIVITQRPPIQQHQGQIMVNSQGRQVAQHAQIQTQDGSFEQPVYQGANPGQIATTVVVSPQQAGDQQRPKTVNASNQQGLLAWSTTNPNVRVVTGGIAQQANGEIANVVTPQGTLITQSQLFNMNAQNGMAHQVAQQVAIQKAQQQSQNLLPNMRRMPQPPGEVSPRKRRQLNTAGTTIIDGVVATRTFSCSGCSQEFARKRDRDNHVRTVHERSFACTKCQARFKTKSDANRHIRIVHERIRPYQCPTCPSMFSERNKLRRHKETVHEKLRPYVCPVCSARFGELGNLRQHTGSLHPDYQVESAQSRSRVNNQVQS